MEEMLETLQSAARKLHGGMKDGPFGPDVALTTAEATVLYRILTEQLGLRFPE